MRLCALLIAWLIGACGGETRAGCELAVHHFLFDLTWPRDTKQEPNDLEMLRYLEAKTVPVCKAEGLSQAQLDCIMAAKTDGDLPALARCPAIDPTGEDMRPSERPAGTADGVPTPRESASPILVKLPSWVVFPAQ